MGFKVSEYSFWDPKKLRVDPNVLLNVVEVEGNLLPTPDYSFIFLSSPPPLSS